MNWCCIILGFVVSLIGGDFIVRRVVGKLWQIAARKHGPGYDYQASTQKAHLTRWLGFMERFFYTGAFFVGGLHGGGWKGVAGLVAIKVIVRWQRAKWSRGEEQLRDSDNIWLIGTGLSVLFGFIGAWIALGHPSIIWKP
jgi:hypothetical protein